MQSSDLKILSQQDLDQSRQPHTKFYDFDFLAKDKITDLFYCEDDFSKE